MKKKSSVVLILLSVILIFSCPQNDGGVPSELGPPKKLDLSLSFSQNNSKSRYSRDLSIEPLMGEIYFKEEMKAANRGNLIKRITPDKFYLNVDSLYIYNDVDDADERIDLLGNLAVDYGNGNVGVLPRHVDVAHSSGFIRDVEVEAKKYSGLVIALGLLTEGVNDGYYTLSLIGVDLGIEYDGIILQNELQEGYMFGIDLDNIIFADNLHYFAVKDIQPFDVPSYIDWVVISEEYTEAGIHHPEGGIVDYEVSLPPGNYGIANAGTELQTSQLFLPGNNIDFTNFNNPELIFSWNINDLIEIYDNSTTQKEDDIITLNLANPFPISIGVQEKVFDETSTVDNTPPQEIKLAWITGEYTNTFQWVNPSDNDFSKIIVTRKQDSAPTYTGDGEIIYENFEPAFADLTAEKGINYYYLLQAVDFNGNKSDGIVLNRIQPN